MLKRFLLVLALAAVGASAYSQDFFHRPSPLAGRTLLTISLFEEVRTEIKSTDDQNKKADALLEKMSADIQEAVGGGDPATIRPAIEKANAKYDEEVLKIYKDDQVKRLKELYLQYNGNAAIQNAAYAKDVKLTDDQKTQLKKLQDEQFQKTMEAFQNGDFQTALPKLQEDFNKSIEKMLTDDQKKKIKDMTGEKFKFKKVEGAGGGR